MNNYEIHPAALLFPMMGEDELRQLANDIKGNGLLEPILLHQDLVLDGRNRLEACKLAGIEPRFHTGKIGSPLLYVISKNLHRRHLTASQKAAIAAEMVPLLAQEKKQSASPIGDVGEKTNAIAAKAMGVGRTSVERVLAVKKADPQIFEEIKEGKISAYAGEIKVKGKKQSSNRKPRAQRIEELRNLAEKGCHDTQIAKELGISPNHVRFLANKAAIAFPSHKTFGKRRGIDANRVMEETVISAQGIATAIELIDGKFGAIDVTKIDEWINDLTAARSALNQLIAILRENRGKGDHFRKDSEKI